MPRGPSRWVLGAKASEGAVCAGHFHRWHALLLLKGSSDNEPKSGPGDHVQRHGRLLAGHRPSLPCHNGDVCDDGGCWKREAEVQKIRENRPQRLTKAGEEASAATSKVAIALGPRVHSNRSG